MSIGGTLAEARQEAGLTVTEVARSTRIRETVIRTIEHDDYTLCGGNFYARGHIRSISRVVGVDPEPLVRQYDDAHGGAPSAIPVARAFEPETPMRFDDRRSPNWSAAMLVALAVVMIFGAFRVFSGGDSPAPATADPAPPPPVAQSPATVPSPAAPTDEVTVRIKAKRSIWVNARDSQGKQLFGGVLVAGAVKEWTVKKKIRLVVGDGGGATLTVNGEDIGAPGKSGTAASRTFLPGDPGR